MKTSRNILVAFTVVSLLPVISFARQGGRANGDRNQGRSGSIQVADCDSTGPQGLGRGQGKGRGNGYGRRGQGAWRQSQQGCQNQKVLDIGPITEVETEHILTMRQEEKLARDVYLTLGKAWSSNVFTNISQSEQRHMDAIGHIVTAYALDDPAAEDKLGAYTDPAFRDLYVKLIEQGKASYTAALQVGAYIEELDILDLQRALDEVENEYVSRVFKNLMRGSHNHLRAFTRGLQAQDHTYVPQLMTQEDYDAIVNESFGRSNGRGNRGHAGIHNQRTNKT